jgi:hypothetical protein
VAGCERLAEPELRGDWRDCSILPNVSELAGALPARLAEEWTRIALMEHASIAAFARFSLQLLSLGAPAELIERATAAISDETRHAKACFALASTYAARPVGPSALEVKDSLAELSLEQIVITTIREGCIGETVAAIEAREAWEHAADPVVRDLLQQISADETRHAELAWRFVNWALELGGPELLASVRAEFEAQLSSVVGAQHVELDVLGRELLRSGVVPEPMRAVIRTQALSQVVSPCYRALMQRDSRTSPARRAMTESGRGDAARCDDLQSAVC